MQVADEFIKRRADSEWYGPLIFKESSNKFYIFILVIMLIKISLDSYHTLVHQSVNGAFRVSFRFVEGDFDTYVAKMRQPHVWGGEPELLMSSYVLQ